MVAPVLSPLKLAQRWRRLARAIWAMAAVLLVAQLASLWVYSRHEGDEAREYYETRVSQQVQLAGRALDRQLSVIKHAAQGLAEELGSRLDRVWSGPRERDAYLAERLTSEREHHLAFASLTLVERGSNRVSHGAALVPAAVRAHTAALFDAAVHGWESDDTHVAVWQAEPGGATFALRCLGGRACAHLLVLELDTADFVATLAAPPDLPELSLRVERADGTVLLSAPGAARTAAAGGSAGPAPGASGASGAAGAAAAFDGVPRLAPSRLDGLPALVATQALQGHGLMVSVSVPLGVVERHASVDVEEFALVAVGMVLITLLLAAGATHLARSAGRADAESAVQHARLQATLASMPDGVLLRDPDNRVLLWNDRYVELFPWLREMLYPGLPFRKVAERAVQAVLPDATDAERSVWVAERIAHPAQEQRSIEVKLPDGRVIEAQERKLPDGSVVASYHDVTASERSLQEAKARAESANAAKSRFLATMSHEMRTPLNGVIGVGDLLRSSRLDPQQRRWADLVWTSGRTLLALINDLLDLSRIEAGAMQIEPRPCNPQALANEVAGLLRERAAAKGLGLEVDVDADLPERVLADPVRLRQVMFNLVGNAVKFTDRGGVRLCLGTREPAGEEAGVELVLMVRDTGVGIPPELLERLFERFSQGESASRAGGSGLGLAITRELVVLMGGSISVDAEPGGGTCFTVTLPLALVDAQAWPSGASRPAALDSIRSTRRLHILAAEDNPVNRILLEAVLSNLGHRATFVGDGSAAVEAVRSGGNFDVVLMDIRMPYMDGIEATRLIRALPAPAGRVPIVAVTANAFDHDRRAYAEVGIDAVVVKPYRLEDVAEVLAGVTSADAADPTAAG